LNPNILSSGFCAKNNTGALLRLKIVISYFLPLFAVHMSGHVYINTIYEPKENNESMAYSVSLKLAGMTVLDVY